MEKYLPAFSLREAARMTPADFRRGLVIGGLFKPGQVRLHYWETDRTVVGGVMPGRGQLVLPAPDELKAGYFTERRELGIINLGGPGQVTVDGRRYAMRHLDTLYVGRGVKRIAFASNPTGKGARFYLLSYPAHATYPTCRRRRDEIMPKVLGSRAEENHRLLYQAIHPGGIRSCQLVMGFTLVQPGSKWNTMPPHTHLRRSEVYCYFGCPRGGSVRHFAGHPSGIRTLRLREGDAVLSPPWSVHSGEGTSHYGFVWGMGGENQDFNDMDPVDARAVLRAR